MKSVRAEGLVVLALFASACAACLHRAPSTPPPPPWLADGTPSALAPSPEQDTRAARTPSSTSVGAMGTTTPLAPITPSATTALTPNAPAAANPLAPSTATALTPNAPGATNPLAPSATTVLTPNAASGRLELIPPSARRDATSPSADIEMRVPQASAFGADLQALGIDPKHPPRIDDLDPRALRGVMKLIAKSLGVKCVACHLPGDYAAPTPQKNVASRMWNEFVVNLAFPNDLPLFCDSCHQGRTTLLERHDSKTLSEWMKTDFVDGLVRKDAVPNRCETCHIDAAMPFLAQWASP